MSPQAPAPTVTRVTQQSADRVPGGAGGPPSARSVRRPTGLSQLAADAAWVGHRLLMNHHEREAARSSNTMARLVQTPMLKYRVIHGISSRQISHANIG